MLRRCISCRRCGSVTPWSWTTGAEGAGRCGGGGGHGRRLPHGACAAPRAGEWELNCDESGRASVLRERRTNNSACSVLPNGSRLMSRTASTTLSWPGRPTPSTQPTGGPRLGGLSHKLELAGGERGSVHLRLGGCVPARRLRAQRLRRARAARFPASSTRLAGPTKGGRRVLCDGDRQLARRRRRERHAPGARRDALEQAVLRRRPYMAARARRQSVVSARPELRRSKRLLVPSGRRRRDLDAR